MNELQRTNEWKLLRKGMITASQVSALLGNHKVQMTEEEIAALKAANPKSRVTTKEVPFSQASYTYLDGKIAEMFLTDNAYLEYQEQFGFENAAMRWGTFWEDTARTEYEKLMGVEVEDAARLVHTARILNASWIGGLIYYLTNTGGYERRYVLDFFESLCSLDDGVIQPANILRKRILKEKLSNTNLIASQLFAFICIAWNAYVCGKELKLIRYNDKIEEYPHLILRNE